MHRPDLALLIAFVSSVFSRFGLCYNESPWQPSYDYYHIDLGELGGHHGGPAIKVPVPKEVMVDVINDLGIKLLAIHNERNENNIAISPYGALSVLAALSEGLQGDAVHEILHAAHIPKDRHVIRVGLRDIHRHLKSYFIPEEGFLAGLTLNLNNVTLRDEYEDVLRFYGFDYGSFNNALYPEPLATQKPFEGTTLGTTLGISEGSTIRTTPKMEDTTIILTDTRFGGTTIETTTSTESATGKEVTTSLLTTTQERTETTTSKEEETTKEATTAATTTVPSTTVKPVTTPMITETTTQDITSTIPETTTQVYETTINELLQTSAASTEKTTETPTTMTTQQQSTTEIPTTIQEESKTTTDKSETESVSITTKISKVTSKISESSFEFSEYSTYLLETSTAVLTTEKLETTEASTIAAQESTTEQVATTSTEEPSTTPTLLTKPFETDTTKSQTTTTESQITTTESQTTATESQTKPTETITSTVISETTPFATTTLPSETTTQKTADMQRTTREISANVMPTDKIPVVIVEETTYSSKTSTVPDLTTILPKEVTTVLPGTTTQISQELTTVSPAEITATPLVTSENAPTELFEVPQEDVETDLTTILPKEVTTVLPDTITQISLEFTTLPPVADTATSLVNPLASFEGDDVQDDLVNSSENAPTEMFEEPQEDVRTTTPFFFGTTPDFQDMTTINQGNFDYNYNYDANTPFNNTNAVDQPPPAYEDNMANLVNNNLMLDTPEGASLNRNLKRRARSVVDYVIARYYDDNHPYIAPPPRPLYSSQEPLQRPQYLPQPEPPQRTEYVPQQEPLTFAVYGKYRESGINFMKYDTVLPFFFVRNLNALALSFPLDSTKYYLLLLLPVEDNGVDQLICDLRLHGNLRYIIEHLKPTHVVATIPSFMLKGYVTLTPLLQRLGIRRIFEPRQADFSPMTNVTDIYVTNIEQAVTVTIKNYLDPSAQHYKNFRQYSPVHFKADHPFLYFVIDADLHVTLMVGKVINPLNSRIR